MNDELKGDRGTVVVTDLRNPHWPGEGEHKEGLNVLCIVDIDPTEQVVQVVEDRRESAVCHPATLPSAGTSAYPWAGARCWPPARFTRASATSWTAHSS